MEMIFAVDENFAIGYKGDMLVHLRTDLRRFQKITDGHILVMGRKTFESLPGQRPLKNRTNLVITRDPSYHREGIEVLHSLEELDERLEGVDERVFLIGGANLVRQLIHKCDVAWITYIQKSFEHVDTVLPNLDESDEWEMVEESEPHEEKGLTFTYRKYERVK